MGVARPLALASAPVLVVAVQWAVHEPVARLVSAKPRPAHHAAATAGYRVHAPPAAQALGVAHPQALASESVPAVAVPMAAHGSVVPARPRSDCHVARGADYRVSLSQQVWLQAGGRRTAAASLTVPRAAFAQTAARPAATVARGFLSDLTALAAAARPQPGSPRVPEARSRLWERRPLRERQQQRAPRVQRASLPSVPLCRQACQDWPQAHVPGLQNQPPGPVVDSVRQNAAALPPVVTRVVRRHHAH